MPAPTIEQALAGLPAPAACDTRRALMTLDYYFGPPSPRHRNHLQLDRGRLLLVLYFPARPPAEPYCTAFRLHDNELRLLATGVLPGWLYELYHSRQCSVGALPDVVKGRIAQWGPCNLPPIPQQYVVPLTDSERAILNKVHLLAVDRFNLLTPHLTAVPRAELRRMLARLLRWMAGAVPPEDLATGAPLTEQECAALSRYLNEPVEDTKHEQGH